MKQSIKPLLIGLVCIGSSFSAFSASQTNEYMQYTFHYSFSEKVNLVLTHYLQFSQEMQDQLDTDITEQTTRFFRQFEQKTSPQLARNPIKQRDNQVDISPPQKPLR